MKEAFFGVLACILIGAGLIGVVWFLIYMWPIEGNNSNFDKEYYHDNK